MRLYTPKFISKILTRIIAYISETTVSQLYLLAEDRYEDLLWKIITQGLLDQSKFSIRQWCSPGCMIVRFVKESPASLSFFLPNMAKLLVKKTLSLVDRAHRN